MMDKELANFTASANFPSIFEDSRTSSMFFPIAILSATIGNILLHWMRTYTQENQYTVLSDRIEAHCLLVIMTYNISILVAGSVLLINPRPGLTFCAAFAVTVRMSFFLVVIIFLIIIVTRLLYLTLWKNVGAMNEDFSMAFVQAVTAVFAILYWLQLIFFQGYKAIPTFVICSRSLPEKDTMIWDPVPGLAKLLLILGTVSMIILAKERKKLDWLHNETKLASGLPSRHHSHRSTPLQDFCYGKLISL